MTVSFKEVYNYGDANALVYQLLQNNCIRCEKSNTIKLLHSTAIPEYKLNKTRLIKKKNPIHSSITYKNRVNLLLQFSIYGACPPRSMLKLNMGRAYEKLKNIYILTFFQNYLIY